MWYPMPLEWLNIYLQQRFLKHLTNDCSIICQEYRSVLWQVSLLYKKNTFSVTAWIHPSCVFLFFFVNFTLKASAVILLLIWTSKSYLYTAVFYFCCIFILYMVRQFLEVGTSLRLKMLLNFVKLTKIMKISLVVNFRNMTQCTFCQQGNLSTFHLSCVQVFISAVRKFAILSWFASSIR